MEASDRIRAGAAIGAAVLAGALSMGLEMLGSRLLAPDFGQSLYTWGALISTVLIALATGYSAGGIASRRHARPRVIGTMLAVGGLWIALLPVMSEPVTRAASEWGDKAGALAASAALFAVPVAAFAFVGPCCIRMMVRDPRDAGFWAGVLSAVNTAGSVAGTLGTSFYLIEAWSVRGSLLAGGIIAAASGTALAVLDGPARAVDAAPAAESLQQGQPG